MSRWIGFLSILAIGYTNRNRDTGGPFLIFSPLTVKYVTPYAHLERVKYATKKERNRRGADQIGNEDGTVHW